VHPRNPANGVCSSRRVLLDDMHSVHNGIGVAPSGVVSGEARGKNPRAEVGVCFAAADAASSLEPTRPWAAGLREVKLGVGIKQGRLGA
jgi:hypothetical protein